MRDGYWNSALTNSISPCLISLTPESERVSIREASSIISNIFPAAAFAFATEGALDSDIPVPKAA